MNITSALLAVQDLKTLTAGIAVDDLLAQQTIAASTMDQLLRDSAIVTAALVEPAQTWRSTIELAATCRQFCVEIAAMAAISEGSLLEPHVPEAFCPPTVWIRHREPDFEDEPNQRTIVRPEVKRKIGFRSKTIYPA